METLYATHHVFPREPKFAQYRPQASASVLSSPSAKSSSDSDSQDDLLPELWLESPPSSNFSFSRPVCAVPPHASSTCCAPNPFGSHVQISGPGSSSSPGSGSSPSPGSGTMFKSHFTLDNTPYFHDYEHQDHFHSSPLLHDDSLEYAQSLLPNSLLFPLAGGCQSLDPEPLPAPVEKMEKVVSTGEEVCVASRNPKPVQQRRGSSTCSAKSKHGSTPCSSGCSKAQCKNLNTQLYKTELCASFMKSGACPYGGKCQFAHGEAELKSVDRPSNWRSKPCANWARTGSCRYGRRCCFKHGE
ncbi:hypothetical protein JCM33374_g4436 [Metschnikowia sp. JCM 33374]|nr:hypothetical protein JCM33374_g4436 [Metschnikowia sp. JCM 33374]